MSHARKVKRSESVLINTDNDIDCEASKTTTFLWEVYKISNNSVTYQPQTETAVYIKTNDQSYLKLAATSMKFGFYKLNFTIIMEGIVGVSGSAVAFVHVVATQDSLKASIEGGPKRRVKFGSTVSFFKSFILAQSRGRRSAEREVDGSNPGGTSTQGL